MNRRSIVARSAPWLVLATLASTILFYRLNLSFDLSAFFPKHASLMQQLLLEQFKTGPGSRLMVIGIQGDDKETLIDASDLLREGLSASPEFRSVQNGEPPDDLSRLPAPIDHYFLLMRDIDYSADALAIALEARVRDLSFAGGKALQDLIAQDPYLVTLDILQRLSPEDSGGGMWFASDGSAVLMAETRAAAIDIAAQSAAVDAVRGAFARLPGSANLQLEITGVGAFSVELQSTIRREAELRSVQATIAVLLVLLVFYRGLRYLLLAAVPLAMGFLCGLATVALLFDNVHGITLAFGFTLMGVAIDYPLHLFSHAKNGDGSLAMQRIWPTLRLGALSTAIAYLALAFADSDGLAQLGIFTASGILVAVAVTRYYLPDLLPASVRPDAAGRPAESDEVVLPWPARFWPALAAAVVAAIALLTANAMQPVVWWDDDLASLSPVPTARLQIDNRLRSAAASADMRYQLVLHDPSLDRLLQRSESLDRRLLEAQHDGLLANWQSVSNLLPSASTQQARRLAIPADVELRSRLGTAVADSAFRADAFEPFLQIAAESPALPPLSPLQFENSPLLPWLQSHLVQIGDTWVALVSMTAPDVDALRIAKDEWGEETELVDLKASSVTLLRDYRKNAIGAVSMAALLIAGLLWLQRRALSRVLWIALTVSVALALTVTVIVVTHGPLTVIHLVALLLVFGLGLDYALFLSRSDGDALRRLSNQAVLAGALSTILAFGVLAASSIPLLNFLGLTVATGSAVSYLLAFAGTWRKFAVS